jgi:hypothetical protein
MMNVNRSCKNGSSNIFSIIDRGEITLEALDDLYNTHLESRKSLIRTYNLIEKVVFTAYSMNNEDQARSKLLVLCLITVVEYIHLKAKEQTRNLQELLQVSCSLTYEGLYRIMRSLLIRIYFPCFVAKKPYIALNYQIWRRYAQ